MKILFDNKEKMPWKFALYEISLAKTALKTGDYTLDGLKDKVVIERKRNTGEIALNLGKHGNRFYKELERMSFFKYKYLICEFTADDILSFPINSGIPPYLYKKIRINGKFLMSRLIKWCEEFNIELHLCGNRNVAENKAMELLLYVEKIEKQIN